MKKLLNLENEISTSKESLEHLRKLTRALNEKDEQIKNYHYVTKQIFDHVYDMLWYKNSNKQYLMANSSLLDNILRLPLEEVLGKTDEEIGAIHTKCGIEYDFSISNVTDDITIGENQYCHFLETVYVDKCTFILDVIKKPLYDDQKVLLGIIGSARNVTKNAVNIENYIHKLIESGQAGHLHKNNYQLFDITASKDGKIKPCMYCCCGVCYEKSFDSNFSSPNKPIVDG